MSAFTKFFKQLGGEPPNDMARLREVVRADPRSTQFVLLADLCRKRKLFGEAIQVCKSGLKHRPGYASGYLALGRAHQEVGDPQNALKAFQQVVEFAPENIVGHVGLGELLETAGCHDEARVHFATAQRLGAKSHVLDERIRRLTSILNDSENVEPTMSIGSHCRGPNQKRQEIIKQLRWKIAALDAYLECFRPSSSHGEDSLP